MPDCTLVFPNSPQVKNPKPQSPPTVISISSFPFKTMSSFCRILCRTFSSAAATTTTTTVKSISTDLYGERNLNRLVEKFKKFSDTERFRCKTGIYEDTVRRLASAKRFRDIEEIIEDQKKYRDISKEGFTARLISLYGKSGMFDNAQKLFDEMPELKCERTVLSFNALLAACVNSKKFDKVDGLFKELPLKLSIEADLVSYNTVIKAFYEMGSLDLAVSILDEMEKKGIAPDLITFNTLLLGYYGNSKFSDGEKIWSRMEEKNVTPDIRSYNSRLLGLALEKKTKEAVEFAGKMRDKGIKLDTFSFNALIKGFVNEGNLEEAKQWFGEIEKNGCTPHKTIYATLIPFLCEKGDSEFALELCKKIFRRRFLVDGEILQLVLDKLVEEGKVEEAKKVIQLGNSNCYCKYDLKLPSDK